VKELEASGIPKTRASFYRVGLELWIERSRACSFIQPSTKLSSHSTMGL
jgi:hypothetical protein